MIETLPLEEVGLDVLEAWIREKPDDRTGAIAAVAGEIGDRPTSLQSMLLEKFDADDGVGSQFYSKYASGGWSGPESLYREKKLSRMTEWLSDARPHVRRWAEKVVASERKGIERARQEEAEERVTRGW